MSRKQKVEPVLPQFKHLRFADVSAIEQAAELDDSERRHLNVLSNLGGYTLAFRILDLSKQVEAVQAEYEEEAGANAFLLTYSWAECCFNDNFNRNRGRQVSGARLRNKAPDWTHTTVLELDAGVMPDQIIVRDLATGEVDLKGHEKAIAKALILNFINEQQPYLFNGSDLDSYSEYLIDYEGQYVIDSAVLLTGEVADGEDVSEETVDVAEDGKAALHSLAAFFAPEVRGDYNIPQPVMDQVMCHIADINAAFDNIIELNSDSDSDSDSDDGTDEDDEDDIDDLDDEDEDGDDVIDAQEDDELGVQEALTDDGEAVDGEAEVGELPNDVEANTQAVAPGYDEKVEKK